MASITTDNPATILSSLKEQKRILESRIADPETIAQKFSSDIIRQLPEEPSLKEFNCAIANLSDRIEDASKIVCEDCRLSHLPCAAMVEKAKAARDNLLPSPELCFVT